MLQRPGKQQPPFDAVLKRGLNAQRDPGGADQCPDDATLAAYCARALPAAQSARWEEHFSNCARCQGVLAAMARARTPGRSAARSLTARRWEVYAALAAGIAGISIVATLTRSGRRPLLADRLIRNQTAISAQAYNQAQEKAKDSGAVIALNEPAQAPGSPSEPRSAAEPAQRGMTSFGAIRIAPRNLLAKGISEPGQRQKVFSAAEQSGNRATFGGFAAKPAQATGAGAQRQLAEADIRREAPAVPAAPPAPARMPGREINTAVIGGLKSSPGRRASPACCAPPVVSMAERPEPPLIVSIRTPDGAERWRLGGNGMIQHLGSEGEWTLQESGVTADLTAGAAPSLNVCWAVGEGGIVLRTTDGAHWQKLTSPTSANLAAVSAQDAASAIVTTAAGERFATNDGGRTWRPL